MDVKDLSCADFVHALGSNAPTPGGGGAAALMGAVGVALGDMVACFTIGKQKYAEVDEVMRGLKSRCERLENRLLDLMEEDAVVFAPLSRAYGMPAATDEEKALKARVMEKCLKDAADAPLRMMRAAAEGLDIISQLADKGSTMMISDAGCAAVCCRAALTAASLNVRINTRSMQDRDYAAALNKEAESLLAQYVPLADFIYDKVTDKCR